MPKVKKTAVKVKNGRDILDNWYEIGDMFEYKGKRYTATKEEEKRVYRDSRERDEVSQTILTLESERGSIFVAFIYDANELYYIRILNTEQKAIDHVRDAWMRFQKRFQGQFRRALMRKGW